jgi:hypothetical protein
LSNLKPTKIILALFALLAFGAQIGFTQDCPDSAVITLGNATFDGCSLNTINVPVFMRNPCVVGGFTIRILAPEPWLKFKVGDPGVADTIGSRISGWEAFSGNVHAISDSMVIVTGIANMPGGRDGIFLPPGDGKIFTIHIRCAYYDIPDTSQLLDFSTVSVADTTGYYLLPYRLVRDRVYVQGDACLPHPRGDANCSGSTNGIDVVYLVNYLKGTGAAFCGTCAGDVNHSFTFNGIDVTYLVMYLKGQVPPLDPCD